MLSTLWIFAVLNYLYCDVLGLMDSAVRADLLAGQVGEVRITPTFLFGAGVLMEIPIAMVLLARAVPWRLNRWLNVAAGLTMTAVQVGSLFVGAPTAYYLFYSVVENAATLFIVWYAWTWRDPPTAAPA